MGLSLAETVDLSDAEGLYPGTVYKQIIEHPVPGKPLGRSFINHDPRSLGYLVTPRAALMATSPVQWTVKTDILDQANLGSCTGNASVGCLGTEPFYDTMQALIAGGLALDEAEAVKVYSLATQLDSYKGQYPPTDTGSDGLSAAKACQQLGLISGYKHATSLDAALTALTTGPVITGVDWYEGFDSPDASGNVTISGQVRGGHEFCLVGFNPATQMIRARNSWGTGYGDKGFFQFSYTDFDTLLHSEGDVTQFVPITAPAPTPTPTPTPPGPPSPPTPTDALHAAVQQLYMDEGGWARARHWTPATKKLAAGLNAVFRAAGVG